MSYTHVYNLKWDKINKSIIAQIWLISTYIISVHVQDVYKLIE